MPAWTFIEQRGRVSDVHFGLTTLHDLVGVTAGAKPGMILSHSLSAGGLCMACGVVKCTSETQPDRSVGHPKARRGV